jgi:hypothetical protein
MQCVKAGQAHGKPLFFLYFFQFSTFCRMAVAAIGKYSCPIDA